MKLNTTLNQANEAKWLEEEGHKYADLFGRIAPWERVAGDWAMFSLVLDMNAAIHDFGAELTEDILDLDPIPAFNAYAKMYAKHWLTCQQFELIGEWGKLRAISPLIILQAYAVLSDREVKLSELTGQGVIDGKLAKEQALARRVAWRIWQMQARSGGRLTMVEAHEEMKRACQGLDKRFIEVIVETLAREELAEAKKPFEKDKSSREPAGVGVGSGKGV